MLGSFVRYCKVRVSTAGYTPEARLASMGPHKIADRADPQEAHPRNPLRVRSHFQADGDNGAWTETEIPART